MKLISRICFLALFLISSSPLFSQLPVLFGLQKIVTTDPDTLISGKIVNGTNYLVQYFPDSVADFYQMVKVNPLSGEIVDQLPLDSAQRVRINCTTYDQAQKRYIVYAQNRYPGSGLEDNWLHSVKLTSNAISRAPVSDLDYTVGLQYDAQFQRAFALKLRGSIYEYGGFDLSTGIFNSLRSLPELAGPTVGATTFDSNNGRFLFIGINNFGLPRLFSLDVDSLYLTQTAISGAGVWMDLEYDINSDELYGIVTPQINDSAFVVRLNMQNGNVDTLVKVPPIRDGGMGTFDYSTGTYLYSSGPKTISGNHRLVMVNVNTAQILSDTLLPDKFYEWRCDNSEYIQLKYGTTATEIPLDDIAGLEVWPQPAHGSFRVKFPASGKWIYTLIDLQGREIMAGETTQTEITFLTENWNPGIYLIRAEDNQGKMLSQKILVD